MGIKTAIAVGVSLIVGGVFVGGPASASASAHHSAMKSVAVPSCGTGVTVHSPVSPSIAVTAAEVGLPAGDPLMAKAAAHHVTWLSSIRCRAHPEIKRKVPKFAATSGNWSGYEADKSGVNLAEMEWKVPSSGYPDGTKNTYSSIWPGIGGGTSSSDELIQDGTEEDALCTVLRGTCEAVSYPTYFWFELYPKEAEQEVTNLTPATGDDVATAASYSSGTAYFTLCDYTKNQCVDGTQTSAKNAAQAEWIVERPTISGSLPPLADYGSVAVTNGYWGTSSATSTIKAGSPFTYSMVNGSDTLSTVGGLNSAGTGFTATWHHYL